MRKQKKIKIIEAVCRHVNKTSHFYYNKWSQKSRKIEGHTSGTQVLLFGSQFSSKFHKASSKFQNASSNRGCTNKNKKNGLALVEN